MFGIEEEDQIMPDQGIVLGTHDDGTLGISIPPATLVELEKLMHATEKKSLGEMFRDAIEETYDDTYGEWPMPPGALKAKGTDRTDLIRMLDRAALLWEEKKPDEIRIALGLPEAYMSFVFDNEGMLRQVRAKLLPGSRTAERKTSQKTEDHGRGGCRLGELPIRVQYPDKHPRGGCA